MFKTHKLNEKGFTEVGNFKGDMADCVTYCLNRMPEGREKSIFKTKIEEAMFFGTKAIAGAEGNYTDIIDYTLKENDIE